MTDIKIQVPKLSPCPEGYSDHIYKRAHGVDVPLRIWPSTARNPASKRAPWFLWMHGGGWIGGKHFIPNAWVVPASRLYGYHVVSIAYRLIPHVQIPDILEDCKDALAWCRANLESILGSDQIDIDNYVVGGDSSGGYLSTMCGHILTPRPRAVVDVFGITDTTDSFFFLSNGLNPWGPYGQPRDEAQLVRSLSERDPSKAEVVCAFVEELDADRKELLAFWGAPASAIDDEKDQWRMDMNRYLSNYGGRMPLAFQRERFGSEEEFQGNLRDLSPLHQLDYTKSEYPPTFIMHGRKDRMVPVDQSKRFEAKMKELGVAVEAVYPPDGDHSFDNIIDRPTDRGWEEYVVPCMTFLGSFTGNAEVLAS